MVKTILNIVLLGKTGHGKSTTGNTILGRKAFDISANLDSVTEVCKLECKETDDMLIRVVDTPGLGDTREVSQAEILQRIFHAMSLCPEGFNALVFVITFGQRFTKEEKETLDILKEAFGEEFITEFCILVMTKGDLFDPQENTEKKIDYNFEDWLNDQTGPPAFMTLLKDCKRRIVLFYNKIQVRKSSFKLESENSLQTFYDLIKSRRSRYTSHHFEKCAQGRNMMIAKLKLPAQSQFVQEQLSLLRQDIQATLEIIEEIKTANDAFELGEKNGTIKAKLNRLDDRIQLIIDKTMKEDNGTGVMQEFIDKMLSVKEDIKAMQFMSDQEKEKRLKTLDITIFEITNMGLRIVNNVFSELANIFQKFSKNVLDKLADVLATYVEKKVKKALELS